MEVKKVLPVAAYIIIPTLRPSVIMGKSLSAFSLHRCSRVWGRKETERTLD